MKVALYECESSFGMEFTPETMQEAALLVRFALNATKDVRGIDTWRLGMACSRVTSFWVSARAQPGASGHD